MALMFSLPPTTSAIPPTIVGHRFVPFSLILQHLSISVDKPLGISLHHALSHPNAGEDTVHLSWLYPPPTNSVAHFLADCLGSNVIWRGG
jgi:hypothetical protein